MLEQYSGVRGFLSSYKNYHVLLARKGLQLLHSIGYISTYRVVPLKHYALAAPLLDKLHQCMEALYRLRCLREKVYIPLKVNLLCLLRSLHDYRRVVRLPL